MENLVKPLPPGAVSKTKGVNGSKKNGKNGTTAPLRLHEPLVKVSHLTKRFGRLVANEDISFTVRRGENLGILGANGSGKTTLVEQIVGLSRPTSGKIEYFFEYNRAPQEKIGMQFQSSSYPDGISVKDIIDFSLDIYNKKIAKDDLMKMLAAFQMQRFYKAPAKVLSGGQQQKLNVLLAILHAPELVILDEISTGLDVLARQQILNFVAQTIKERGLTAILISHHMQEIELLCRRAIVLSRGKVMLDAPVAEMIAQYGSLDAMMKQFVQAEIDKGNTGEPELVRKWFRWRNKGNGKRK